jgi:2-polyprenyl-6-methoxyphenol hydroxylase-like FAD-dependent oxidoreductase
VIPDVIVVGAGIAGLATSLFVARAGGTVLLLESDQDRPPARAAESLARWDRPGVPQMGQGHNIHGLARLVLRDRVADVLERLLGSGVTERRFAVPSPAGTPPHSAAGGGADAGEEMVALQARRSVFEWVLRTAVGDEPRIRIRRGVRVTGLLPDAVGARGVVLASGETVRAPWVVDASGRTSALPRWLAQSGAGSLRETSQASRTLYYARHFRLHPGRTAPSGDWLFGPSGDHGFLRYSVLSEDTGHFVITLKTPSWDRELRCLRDEGLWMRAARTFGPLREWLRQDLAAPASPVFTMGGLSNRLRDLRAMDAQALAGFLPLGDALCHTNPSHGWGASLALYQAGAVADTVTAHGDRATRTAASIQSLTKHVAPYYRVAAGEDAERLSAPDPQNGVRPDWERPENPLFFRKVMYPQARRDPVLFLAVQRRIHLIDPPDLITRDPGLQRRALRLHRTGGTTSAAMPGEPSRAELLRVLGRQACPTADADAGTRDGEGNEPRNQDPRKQHA